MGARLDAAPMAFLWRLRQPGCPACLARQELEASSLSWFFLENYREGPTLRALIGKRFCAAHVGMLLAAGELKLSVTLEFLAGVEAATIGQFRKELRRHRHDRRSRLFGRGGRRVPPRALRADEPDHCPSCEAGRTAATVATAEVLSLLDDPRGRSAYAESQGLCRPHAWLALGDASNHVADWLAQDLQRRLLAAQRELNRYFEYLQGADAGYPRSGTSARAARLLWGEEMQAEPSPDIAKRRPETQLP